MKDLLFVTNNREKYTIAREELIRYNIRLIRKPLLIDEIQSADIEEVAIKKAKAAFRAIHKPLIIMDSGLYIEALNGFPGPYTKYAEKWFGAGGLIKLIKTYTKNRKASVKKVIVYVDRRNLKVFSSSGKGEISDRPKGNGGNWFECILMDQKTGKTLGQFKTERERTMFWGDAWDKFGRWYSKNGGKRWIFLKRV